MIRFIIRILYRWTDPDEIIVLGLLCPWRRCVLFRAAFELSAKLSRFGRFNFHGNYAWFQFLKKYSS